MAVPLMFQPLAKYARFEGRSRRSEFWLWMLFRFMVGLAMGVFALSLVAPFFSDMATHPQMDQTQLMAMMAKIFRVYPLFMLIDLGLLLPTLTVAVRRLHDINRSGLWLLMPVGVSFGGAVLLAIAGVIMAICMATAHPDGHVTGGEGFGAVLGLVLSYAAWLIAVLVADIVLLIFLVTDGTRGPNRFGLDPKAVAPAIG